MPYMSQKSTTAEINTEVPFIVAINKELQHRIKAYTRTDEERQRFAHNALSFLADVYEGKRKMPQSVMYHIEQHEEQTFF